MTQDIHTKWQQWKQAELRDEDLKQELLAIGQAGDSCEALVEDRFYKDLEFGTGGLRGILGVGTNRLNIYTVGQATQGYARYLKKEYEGSADVAVALAYDSRIKSAEFAKIAASILAAEGIRAYLFPELVPTPVLSFAVRYLKCQGGIVITASHNPAEYNGYKVYGADGGQITGETAKAIAAEIKNAELFDGVNCLDGYQTDTVADRNGVGCAVKSIGPEVLDAYENAVIKEAFGGSICRDVPIVYSPLNGTGLRPVCHVLKKTGFSRITIVKEQRDPDGRFPTCPTPNPEKAEAMKLGIEYARQNGAELVLATDPDCDRVGLAVRNQDEYRLLSGNETGVLLMEYVCRRRKEMGRIPDHAKAVKTIVTSDLIGKIGAAYGVAVTDVLTGFKYIGEFIGNLESEGREQEFIMGAEESHGYLSGTYVRDKDGVNGVLLICEMAGYYKCMGKNLYQVLEEIYRTYGYYVNRQYTYTFEGEQGSRLMRSYMDQLRCAGGSEKLLGGRGIRKSEDYLRSMTDYPDGRQEKITLPVSNVIKVTGEDGCSVTVRPSGTEPKLKIYTSAVGESEGLALALEQELAGHARKMVEAWQPKGSITI